MNMKQDKKEKLLAKMSELLMIAAPDVDNLELSQDGEYVYIHYKSGHTDRVCIACDSPMAIIRDVARKIQ